MGILAHIATEAPKEVEAANTGAIIGGIIGAILVILIITVVLRRSGKEEEGDEE